MAFRILICEDNEKNRRLIIDILEYHGFEVYTAVDDKEEIKMAKKIMPDLTLMGMRMPVLDGFEAIKKDKIRS